MGWDREKLESLTVCFECGELVFNYQLLMQTAHPEVNLKTMIEEASSCKGARTQDDFPNESLVSFQEDLPLNLQAAMKSFIEQYPNWDQYRLIQAALSGFLVQNGVETRDITRLYVANMFSTSSSK